MQSVVTGHSPKGIKHERAPDYCVRGALKSPYSPSDHRFTDRRDSAGNGLNPPPVEAGGFLAHVGCGSATSSSYTINTSRVETSPV
ncbi:hypothetical protein ACWDA7_21130, partial [Streptomyces sp. NPDC001156]